MLWIQLQRNVGQVPTPKPLTSGPWQQLSINFCEVAGHYVLVMNDYYSRFPEVDKVHLTGAKTAIPKLSCVTQYNGQSPLTQNCYRSCIFPLFSSWWLLKEKLPQLILVNCSVFKIVVQLCYSWLLDIFRLNQPNVVHSQVNSLVMLIWLQETVSWYTKL